MSSPAPETRARRSPRAVLDLTVVLGLLVPLGAVALLLAGGTEQPATPTVAPERTTLTASTVVCPSALGTREAALVATTGDAAGEVASGPDRVPVPVRPGRPGVLPGTAATVVRAEGDLAPGLVAGRTSTRPVAATDCPAPAAEQWFTGVGAGAQHRSVLELVNPNPGPAVADVVVLAGSGVVDAPRLRGLLVPGGATRRLDLARLLPREGELALRVTTTRGRLAAVVEDTHDEVGRGPRSTDWLPPQAAPAPENVLLGLPAGRGSRTLVVANPGDDEARVAVRVVTAQAAFVPRGLEEVRVPPQSVVRVSLERVLGSDAAEGALGLDLRSTRPVTAALRSLVAGDVALAVPGPAFSGATAAVVPTGRKQLVLGSAEAVGLVDVVARDADGRQVLQESVELTPGGTVPLDLPRAAVLVEVRPERTPLAASVVVTGDGATVVPLHELARSGLVADVRPGFPGE